MSAARAPPSTLDRCMQELKLLSSGHVCYAGSANNIAEFFSGTPFEVAVKRTPWTVPNRFHTDLDVTGERPRLLLLELRH